MSFFSGAFFFFAAVLYTVITTKEYPPADVGYKEKVKESNKGFGGGFAEIWESLTSMPKQMKIVSAVQFFTWPGLFLMWFYYTTAVATNIYGGVDNNDPLYAKGADFAGLTLAFYNVVTFLFALVLPSIANKIGRKATHSICLLAGALGLISVGWVKDPQMLYLSMLGVGIAWTSILSMPYAMISKSLPLGKVGIYMGIFNFFIVLPEIIASFGFGSIMKNVLHNDRLLAVQIGGALFIVAAIICYLFVKDERKEN
jgi:maltose/moltooligosaccharide transporter